jgi:hypothetical protein
MAKLTARKLCAGQKIMLGGQPREIIEVREAPNGMLRVMTKDGSLLTHPRDAYHVQGSDGARQGKTEKAEVVTRPAKRRRKRPPAEDGNGASVD